MTHDTEGKYITLDELKVYGLGTIADPNNPTVYNNAVQGSPDDSILRQSIYRAEMEFDRIAGIQFDQQTVTGAQAFQPFVDGNGWLSFFAREHAPVTAVTSLEYRDLLSSDRVWKSVSYNADDLLLPINDGYAHPDCAYVKVLSTAVIPARSTGQILVRWTYTGGFATVPNSLKSIITRLAWWIYKLREAPMQQIVMPNLGIMQIPLRIPPDINADILLWQPGFS
jgi:hypothetical protein